MLEIDDLHRRFGDVQALAGVSFTVPSGQIVGFVGRNGAGKTTTMRIALGLSHADDGEVRWCGHQVQPEERRRVFGYLPEERGLYPKMRVADQLRYFGQLHGLSRREASERTDDWLGRLGLGDRHASMLDDLSLGNQQRVQLAAALLHRPQALVLDEPFSGLDPVGVDAMADALAAEVAGGAAVVFSSHQLDLVERLCDSVVIIDAGRVVAKGTIAEVRAERATRRFEVRVTGGLPTGWLDGVGGVERAAPSGDTWYVDVAGGADDQAVLDAARRHGPIEQFGRVVPTLAELFREVVR